MMFLCRCMQLIEDEMKKDSNEPAELVSALSISADPKAEAMQAEIRLGRQRVKYMYIYELTR